MEVVGHENGEGGCPVSVVVIVVDRVENGVRDRGGDRRGTELGNALWFGVDGDEVGAGVGDPVWGFVREMFSFGAERGVVWHGGGI